jgi:hypothetical protein
MVLASASQVYDREAEPPMNHDERNEFHERATSSMTGTTARLIRTCADTHALADARFHSYRQ